MNRTIHWWPAGLLFLWFLLATQVQAQGLVAADDAYQAPAGSAFAVGGPGVLENDSLEGEDLPETAQAVLLSGPPAGTGALTCGGAPAPSLCADGSFSYAPPPGFTGTTNFTYQIDDGGALSNEATVTITVSGCQAGNAVDFVCWLESSYLDTLAQLGYDVVDEGFEDDTVWGSVRTTVGDQQTAPTVSSQGIAWTSNFDVGPDANMITTGAGGPHGGGWELFSLPHGDQTAVGQQFNRDGVKGTDEGSVPGAPALVGVGAWVRAPSTGKINFILDDTVQVDFPDPFASAYQFFGVIDTTGFATFEVVEMEGKAEQNIIIFADDFTVARSERVFTDGFETGDGSEWTLIVSGVRGSALSRKQRNHRRAPLRLAHSEWKDSLARTKHGWAGMNSAALAGPSGSAVRNTETDRIGRASRNSSELPRGRSEEKTLASRLAGHTTGRGAVQPDSQKRKAHQTAPGLKPGDRPPGATAASRQRMRKRPDRHRRAGARQRRETPVLDMIAV